MILNGEKMNSLLMTIIRFVLPSQVRFRDRVRFPGFATYFFMTNDDV